MVLVYLHMKRCCWKYCRNIFITYAVFNIQTVLSNDFTHFTVFHMAISSVEHFNHQIICITEEQRLIMHLVIVNSED